MIFNIINIGYNPDPPRLHACRRATGRLRAYFRSNLGGTLIRKINTRLIIEEWETVAWTIPFWIAMLLGLVQAELWRWPRIAAPLVVAGLTLVHSVFWTDLRMRAPIVPAIALIAAGASWPAMVRSGRIEREVSRRLQLRPPSEDQPS
jgi:hypothetical protein